MIVLIITMIKEIIEDTARHKADNRVNNSVCTVLRPDGKLENILWKDLRVGEIIMVQNKHQLPADCLLLASTNDLGVCYIETSNLDG